jgi:hypothetical protein
VDCCASMIYGYSAEHLIVVALKLSYNHGALPYGLASCNASTRMITRKTVNSLD